MLSINISETIWTVINFFLLYFLLKHFLYTPVLRFMEKRQAGIDAKLNVERDAKTQVAENEERLLTEKEKSREEATALAKVTLKAAQDYLDEQGLENIHICPEVMGKINQLGDLSEVLEFCTIDERFIPCVDFGHLNSRMQGTMDYVKALDEIGNTLGIDRLRNMHIHFSKIEYTAGGEKRHLTFADEIYGPQFEPLIEQFILRDMSPSVICESAGTQTDDAAAMMRYYKECSHALR